MKNPDKPGLLANTVDKYCYLGYGKDGKEVQKNARARNSQQ